MRLLVFSNIYIAAAAVLLTRVSYLLLGSEPGWGGLDLLVFCGTVFVYNLDRLVSSSREDRVETSERHRWIERWRRWLWGLVAAGGAGVVASLLLVPRQVLWALVPLGLISLGYSLPVLAGDSGMRRLKEVEGLKIFLIALVWAGVAVVLPAVEAAPAAQALEVLGSLDVWWMVGERFVFIVAITLPFDIRDMERDRQSDIRTIPLAIGAGRARWLAVGLMAVFTGLVLAHYGIEPGAGGVALAISGVTTTAILCAATPGRGEMYYVGLLDGTMIAQWALVWAF